MDERRRRLLEINVDQKAFYERQQATAGAATRLWRVATGRLYRLREALGVQDAINALHWRWLGDLSDSRVLDLGCSSGNYLSVELAERSSTYLGIDLSQTCLNELQEKINRCGLQGASTRAVDFLSDEFSEREFDVVYAQAVMHHFQYVDVLVDRLYETLKPGGIAVTYDPLETYWPLRIARSAYRPFQSDKQWEWPFTRRTFDEIRRRFEIVEVQGLFGHAKWALPLAFLNMNMAVKCGDALTARDFRDANRLGPGLWRCLHVTMCIRKPPAPDGS